MLRKVAAIVRASVSLARLGLVPASKDAAAYPYFFADPDGDGVCSAAEAVAANAFSAWTAPLMRAAHNYQLSRKEPGAWAHNFEYIGQLLFDSSENLAQSSGTLTRP